MRIKKIKEYPYTGKIHHIREGVGMREDEPVLIYEGEMDLYKRSDMLSNDMDSARYIIYIPSSDKKFIPNKGDKIEMTVDRYVYFFDVENAILSQLHGIEIFATRNAWDYGI